MFHTSSSASLPHAKQPGKKRQAEQSKNDDPAKRVKFYQNTLPSPRATDSSTAPDNLAPSFPSSSSSSANVLPQPKKPATSLHDRLFPPVPKPPPVPVPSSDPKGNAVQEAPRPKTSIAPIFTRQMQNAFQISPASMPITRTAAQKKKEEETSDDLIEKLKGNVPPLPFPLSVFLLTGTK